MARFRRQMRSPECLPGLIPTNVEVLEGGVPTATISRAWELVLPPARRYSLSEGIVTEVTFTIDPPAPVTAPPVTSTEQVTGNGSIILVPTTGSVNQIQLPVASPIKLAGVPRDTARLRGQIASVKHQIKVLQTKLDSRHLSRSSESGHKEAGRTPFEGALLLRKLK